MRDRHIPRLCRTCDAQMGRQQDSCWRCGVRWDGSAVVAKAAGAAPPAARALISLPPESAVPAVPAGPVLV